MTFQKDVTREMTGPEADEKRQKIVELTLKADSLDNDVETLQGEVKSKKAEAVALRKSVSNMAADIQRHKTTDTFLCDRLVAYDDDGPYWAFVPENLPELAADEIPLHEIARSEMSEDDQEKYKKGPLLEAIEGNERKPPETAPEEEEGESEPSDAAHIDAVYEEHGEVTEFPELPEEEEEEEIPVDEGGGE